MVENALITLKAQELLWKMASIKYTRTCKNNSVNLEDC